MTFRWLIFAYFLGLTLNGILSGGPSSKFESETSFSSWISSLESTSSKVYFKFDSSSNAPKYYNYAEPTKMKKRRKEAATSINK